MPQAFVRSEMWVSVVEEAYSVFRQKPSKSRFSQHHQYMAESTSQIQSFASSASEPDRQTSTTNQQADHAFETLIHRIHHDLNGPLASIAGLVQIARMETDLPSVFSHLDNIHRLSNKLTRILEELMQISHLHAGDPLLHEMVLAEEIQTVISGFSEWPEARAIRLNADLQKIYLSSDPIRLRNVLSHILSNSIHHHDPSKSEQWINISTGQNGDHVEIHVVDNGKGIDPEFLGKVFDMFSVGGNHKGSGLGLYLAKTAVRSLGGEIQIESEAGTGTHVMIRIPAGMSC